MKKPKREPNDRLRILRLAVIQAAMSQKTTEQALNVMLNAWKATQPGGDA